ncbi:glycoside hydrolase family 3 N-terminal domain-containing protein [Spirosoma utsteinense]|uniref:beta-N-acetylhexosaminidase n=1 Tax=Spirosoma utsteinense TaxID=2585773 RepID=A0ABR6W6E0_9BACT|nr:glycoside hydrolase family 3 N-terminal domain-containing protein [Spirosoma utsteinense]MBC3785411.1 beta-glucosidase-like glycosyl hydrolase/CubicO group peptidase (beta-lactamase class C family) [Spirosoma utsteinense]MBC3791561.1 beta-glucosidase-like glycosyl hydrolase/CubicO group peptidase (beta-lactamase class C family) [Spirosoma utsteinense]
MRNNIIRPVLLVGLLSVSLLTAFGLTNPGRTIWTRLALPKTPYKATPKRAVTPPVIHPRTYAKPVEVFAMSISGEHWVDSVFNTLTPEQKVGQFFMVATFSNRHENHYQYIDHLIQSNHVGGLIFFQGGPHRQAVLTNRYQAQAKVPLLIGIDGEWGLGMRLDSTMDFPKQMSLGAIRDNELIYRMGAEIGRQCQRLGIHINFAPVSDINSNPANPVIGVRSFGESKENVALKASAYMRGLQGTHVIATAKHFPGHGNTNVDSHHSLPTVSRSSEQMRDIDLYPFRKLIADSLMGVVTGHLHVPVMDNTPALAATLSEKIVTELLKNELGFRGLVFTDALNMGGISHSPKTMDINLRALIAGNDILLYPENVREAAQHILNAVQQGIISQSFIDEKVKKILRAKYWAGLSTYKPIDLAGLSSDLNSPEAELLKRELCEQSVTLVNNQNGILPFNRLDTLRFASIAIGADAGNVFQKTLNQYAPFQTVALPEKLTSEADLNTILAQVNDANVAVVSFHRMSESATRRYGITKQSLDLIARLKQRGTKVIVTAFGSPYSLPQFTGTDALVCAYQDIDEMQQVVPQMLFGGLGTRGMLPISSGDLLIGMGEGINPEGRLSIGSPESVGMKSAILAKIDAIAQGAVRDHVVPGCEILVARRGKVVYNKNFGALTYAPGAEKVTDETLYDLASLTKVLATLQSVMVLYDRKQIDLTQKASAYLPELRGTNKQNIVIQDLLWHQSGMVSYYPTTWDRTRKSGGGLKAEFYNPTPDSLHTLQVAPSLWAVPALRDSVWKWVVQSPMSRKNDESGKPAYVYSDLNFLTLQKIVERVSQQPLDKFVTENIYKPLGLHQLGFTPLLRLKNPHCAPTEQDTYYRNQLLVGTVHDQMAAVQGGISGHAGLFGNARDIATLLQMNLQKGMYGQQRILNPMTVPYFTQTLSSRSHRSLGWDKPNPESPSSVYMASQASARSFGHTGFTGNVVWVDPDEELVFVFLSNRIYPTAGNNSINTTKLRRRIHEVIYSATE